MDINEIIKKKGETEAAVWNLVKAFEDQTSTEIESIDLRRDQSAGRRAQIVTDTLDVRLPKFPIPEGPQKDFQETPPERTGDTHYEDELGPITNL